MPSFPQVSLMTQILNLEEVNVLNYSIIENVGIFLFVEEKEKGGVCPKCQSRTQKIHKNNEASPLQAAGYQNQKRLSC